ncbi:MAG: VCBS repeat-containing protein [Nitrospirae bacterium]|nr:VCBS repeat-containing protein [Nitrospirota bacterium]MBF0591464.1 VCBS repeat-containing protein [Nitrospirota bacterium]
MKLKIKGLGSVIVLLLTILVTDANAGNVIVPVTLDNWTGYSQSGNVSVSATGDGIQVNGYGKNQGALERTVNPYDFTASQVYIKWKAHGAGYMNAVVGIGDTTSNVIVNGNTSTVRSVSGSTIIADDTWYYTRIRFSNDSTAYLTVTATGNYDDSDNSTVFMNTNGTISNKAAFQNGVVYASISDNEGGTDAYIVIGEAKIIKSLTCNTVTNAGSDKPESFTFDMGATSGTFYLDYNTYTIEDEIFVYYQGTLLYDTGCVGKSDSVPLSFSGTSSVISVSVTPNCTGTTSTAWTFTVSCPVGGISVYIKPGDKGTVVSNDNQVHCRDDGLYCTIAYKTPVDVTLTAYADLDYSFTGWGKDCAPQGEALSCTLSTWYERFVTAQFTPNELLNKLTITKSGRASGTVTPSGGRIIWTNNNNTGTAFYQSTDQVTLTPVPDQYADFMGWSGDCTGSTCTLTMAGEKNVEARFEPKAKINVIKAGNGLGTVTPSSGTITWSGKTGLGYYTAGTSLILTAAANPGSAFNGWSNDCAGSDSTCTVAMLADRTATATFNLSSQPRAKLTVTKNGTGVGTVSTSAGTLAWYNNVGTATYDQNTQVALIATPSAGSAFAGWSGDCSAANTTCTTTMSTDKNVAVTFTPSGSSKTTYDFDGNGTSDALWRDISTGNVYIWLMQGTTISIGDFAVKGLLDWVILGVGDFNGDGKSDIVLQNKQGDVYIWLMDGTKISTGGYATRGLSNAWTLKAVGDFDSDGKADILWQNSNGDVYVWLMDGANIKNAGYIARGVGAEWKIKAVADLNGDKKSDIIWQNTNTGAVFVWLMDITSISKGDYVVTGVSGNWQLKAVADFDADGKADILWQDTTTGDLYLWLMDGTNIVNGGYVRRAISADWQIQKVGDYNGDGKADILWQNTTTGDVYIYLMDGVRIANEGYTTKTLPPQWQIE